MDEWEIDVQWGDNFKWDLKKVVHSNLNLIWYVSVISLISYSDETNWYMWWSHVSTCIAIQCVSREIRSQFVLSGYNTKAWPWTIVGNVLGVCLFLYT